MFRNFKNTFKIISFLSLVLLTTFFVISVKPDAAVAASFSVPSSARAGVVTGQHIFTLKNHSKALLKFDFTELSEGRNPLVGNIEPGQSYVTRAMSTDMPLEIGNISSVIAIADAPNPSFRFWSGGVEFNKVKDQYIDLLEGNGYKVTKNTEEGSEITGNGFRITVDGGGVKNPEISHIHIQVYNA